MPIMLVAGARRMALVVALAGAASPAAWAEQPSWAQVRAPLYAILPHWHTYIPDQRTGQQGIWRFDPATRTYRRLTTFFFNGMGGVIPSSQGEGSYLTAIDDRLLFESFPAYIEFDAASGRGVRRYSGFSEDGFRGWAVQGPALASPGVEQAEGLPGVAGFLRCVATLFPRDPAPLGCTANPPIPWTALAARGAEPDGGWQQVVDVSSFQESRFLDLEGSFVSYDPARYGLRMGGCAFWGEFRSMSFVPVQEGGPDFANAVRKEIPASTCGREQGTEMFFFDPGTDSFFAVRHNPRELPYERSLLRLDLDLNVLEVLGTFRSGQGDPVPWTVARLPEQPPEEYVQTIPSVVHAPGLNGTFWTSELWLYNPSSQATTVRVRRVTAPGGEESVDLAGHASLRIPDVLSWVGGGPAGDGTTHEALVITTPYRWGEQVVAASRTSTPPSDEAERAAGGSMGQGVVAVPGRVGYSNHLLELYTDDLEVFVGRPAVLILERREAGRFRHNLGMVNDSDEPLTVTLGWGYTEVPISPPRPWEGNTREVTVHPHGVAMVQLEGLFGGQTVDSLPALIAVTANRPAILFFSMVDNRTGDGTFVPFTHVAMQGGEDTRFALPVVAHLPGEHGSAWKSDLYLEVFDRGYRQSPPGPGYPYDQPRAHFHPAVPADDCAGAVAAGGELSGFLLGVAPFPTGQSPGAHAWRSIFPDVVHQFAPCAGDGKVRGALELRVGSWTAGYARTYTTREDGGTYGEILPLYPEHGWPVQHFAGIEVSPAFRVNLGLYNGDTEHAITHRLTLYAADGRLVAQREVVLDPWANDVRPLEVWLGMQPGRIPSGTYGLTVLPLDDPAHGVEGRSWAFLSLIDNVTNDPSNWW
jgi:hypothetical protein